MTGEVEVKKPPWAATKKLTPEVVIDIMKEGAGFINPPFNVFNSDDYVLKKHVYGSNYIILSSCPKCGSNSIVGKRSGTIILFECKECNSSFKLVEE